MNDVSGSRFCVSGVGTQMMTAPPSRTTSKSVRRGEQARRAPAGRARSAVTSPTYDSPALICATLPGSGSTHTTRVPVAAKRTASGRPTYPAPITATSHATRHTVPVALLTDDQSERFQVVDADDREIAVRTRAECHADRSLIHRSVFVCVESSGGHRLPAPRARQGLEPGLVVPRVRRPRRRGRESYRDAAERELAEEAGIVGAELEHAGTFLMELPGRDRDDRVFRARYDGPLTVLPPEVIGLAAFPAGEVPEPLTPSAVMVLDFLRAG